MELNIEQQIREAMERGDFDNLSGKGKPLDLSAYFATPEDLRLAYSLLKSNDFVPEEIELLKEMSKLREQVKITDDAAERALLTKQLNEKTLAYTIAVEKHKKRK